MPLLLRAARWLTVMARVHGRGVRIWGVERGEFAADLVGVGVVDVVEDGQGLLPGLAGGVVVAGAVVGVAEVAEDGGFAVAVAEVAVQGEGGLP
jgi:hypothetical protein